MTEKDPRRMLEVRRQENELARKSSKSFSEVKKTNERSYQLRQTYVEKLEQINALMRDREAAVAMLGQAQRDAETRQLKLEQDQRDRQLYMAEAKKKAKERGTNALKLELETEQAKVDAENANKKRKEEIYRQENDRAHKVAEDYRERQKTIDERLRQEAEDNFIRPGGQVIRGNIDFSKTHFHNPVIVKHDLTEINAIQRAKEEAEIEQKRIYHEEGLKLMQDERAKNRGEEALFKETIEREYQQMAAELELLRRADGNYKIAQGTEDNISQNRCIITESQKNQRKQQALEQEFDKIYSQPVKEKTRLGWNLKETRVEPEKDQKAINLPKVEYIPTVSQEVSTTGHKKIVIKDAPSNDPFEFLKKPKQLEKVEIKVPFDYKRTQEPKKLLKSSSSEEGSEASEDEDVEVYQDSSEESNESLDAKYKVLDEPKPKAAWNLIDNKQTNPFTNEILNKPTAAWRLQDTKDIEQVHASVKEEPEYARRVSYRTQHEQEVEEIENKYFSQKQESSNESLEESEEDEAYENKYFARKEEKPEDLGFKVTEKRKPEEAQKPTEQSSPNKHPQKREIHQQEKETPKKETYQPVTKEAKTRDYTTQEQSRQSTYKAPLYDPVPIQYPSFPVYTPIPVMPIYPYPVPNFSNYLNPNYGQYTSQITPQFTQQPANFRPQTNYEEPPSLGSSKISALSMSPAQSSTSKRQDFKSPISLLDSASSKEEQELGQTSFFPKAANAKTEFSNNLPESQSIKWDLEDSNGENPNLKPIYDNKKGQSWDFDFEKLTSSSSQLKKREVQTAKPVKLEFGDSEKSLADIFKEKKQRTLEHLQERDPKPAPKADKKGKTKEELIEIRKNFMKHQKTKEEIKRVATIDKSKPHPKSDLMARLAQGEKTKVSKEDMKKLTNKNYEMLPEVKKKKEEDKKKQEMTERRQKAKEFEKKRQETRFKGLNKSEY